MNNATDLRRIAGFAIVMLVLLRISIGWQFLYEGLWKFDSLDSNRPWTADGYLRNAQGPFRNVFRNMTGDPDELDWLDYESVASRWDDWQENFADHYGLSDGRRRQLDELVNGQKQYVAELKALPEGVELPEKLGSADRIKIINFDKDAGRLVVSGEQLFTPREREALWDLVPEVEEKSGRFVGGTAEEQQFYKAVRDVYSRAKNKMGYKNRLRAELRGNVDRVGTKSQPTGELQKYEAMLDAYEKHRSNSSQDFEQGHLAHTWQEIQSKRAELTGPIKALDAELKAEARKFLDKSQLASGRVPDGSQSAVVAKVTMWSLVVLGLLLIVGLGSRFAAVLGAGMLLSFYLVWPPWPGVPEAPGVEHSLFVNKNLIEMIALLAIAATPTGSWFGLDGLFSRYFRREKVAHGKPKPIEDTKVAPAPVGRASSPSV